MNYAKKPNHNQIITNIEPNYNYNEDYNEDYNIMNNIREKKSFSESRRRTELLEKSPSAERDACRILGKIGISHIRQYPIWTGRKKYFADIYIPSIRLIIEIDGAYHFNEIQKRKDENRSSGLRRLGYHLCRLTNKDARNPQKIMAKIKRYIKR